MSTEKRHLAAVGQNLNAAYKDAFLHSLMVPLGLFFFPCLYTSEIPSDQTDPHIFLGRYTPLCCHNEKK